MKINRTALAAAASVVAVVVAGTAALAANFGILSGSEGEVDSTPGILSTVDPQAFTEVPVEQVTATTAPGETLAYQVEGVGVVTLTRTGDTLAVASIDVDPQWDVVPLTTGDGVSIRFTSSDQVFAFSASVIDGQVMVDVVDETPAPASSTYDDDEGSYENEGGHDDEGSYDDD